MRNIDKPTYYWQALLESWVNNHNKHGLTIPFIIGAKSILQPGYKPTISDIDDLINEIITSDGDFFIEASVCASLNVFVLHLVDKPIDIQGIVVTHPTSGKTKLSFLTEAIPLYTSDKLIERMKSEALEAIENGNYSRNQGTWGDFTAEDILMIKDALWID